MKMFSEQIDKTRKLLIGLKDNIELVKDKGLDKKFIIQLESDNNLAATYNEEIDKLKAAAKEKARETSLKLLETNIQVKKAKKIIKQNFSQNSWKNFGIKDKR